MASNRPCAGSPAVESIPIVVRTLPFAGWRASEGLGRLTWAREESPTSRHTWRPMTMGCSSSLGEGEPLATSICGVASRGEGRSFTPGGSAHAAHCLRFNPSSAQPAVGSWRCPQAASWRAMTFGVSSFGVLAAPKGWASMGLTWLAARSSRKGWATARRAPRKGRAGSEGKREGQRGSKRARSSWRGEDRALEGCARASLSFTLQKSIGSVGPREACALNFTRFGERTGTGV